MTSIVARITAVCLVLASLSFVEEVRGEAVYDVFFRTALGDSFDDTITVAPGVTISDAEIIWRETITDPTEPNLGLNGGQVVGIVVTTEGANGTFANLTGNSAFPSDIGDSPITVHRAVFPPNPAAPATDRGGGVYEIQIATIDITAPTSGSTVFLADDINPTPGFSNFEAFGANPPILDELIRFRTLTVTAVPEPSGAILLLSALALLPRRRRRRR